MAVNEATSGWDVAYDQCECNSTGGCDLCRPYHISEEPGQPVWVFTPTWFVTFRISQI